MGLSFRKNRTEGRFAGRFPTLNREFDGSFHVLLASLLDFLELFRVLAKLRYQLLAESFNGITVSPVVKFFLATIVPGISARMSSVAIGLVLQKCRSFTRPSPVDSLGG